MTAGTKKNALPRDARQTPLEGLTRRRRWLFRGALLLAPLLLLGVVEIGLRVGGYGYNPDFFRRVRIGAEDYFVQNEDFSFRFFPRETARNPGPVRFPAHKAPGTFRVFIFGESAAMGDPAQSFAPYRYLEMMLREKYPDRKFELINVAFTAINSHVILPIARECAAHEGDLWIIYMGNNEMVGPYGAATVFGLRAPPLWAVRLNLALQETRVGQLLVSWARGLGGKSKRTVWGGMEMFLENQISPQDPRKQTVYRNFAANLRDIVNEGLHSGAKVILSTVSVNLRDCPPFASLANTNLPAAEQARFQQLLAEGKSLQAQSNLVAAAERFAQAEKIDPQFAETHFRRGQCLLDATNAAAHEPFQRACDTDALPFRADTQINTTIRRFAQDRISERLMLCDAEDDLAKAGPGGSAGDESFYEHVHFNPRGNYRLALAWAEQIARWLPQAGGQKVQPTWATQEQCDEALGLTLWNRYFLVQTVMRRMGQPPLSTQPNNAERLVVLRAEAQDLLRQQAEPGAVQRVRQSYETLLERSPNDPFLYEGLANFLEATGDTKGAIDAYRRLNQLLPDDFYSCLQLGRLLGEQGQLEQAQPFLEKATRLRPSLPEGWHELGVVLAAQEKFPAALECMLRAEQIRPTDAANVCFTAKVLAKLQRRPEAIERYRRAIQLRPEYWEARFELAGELAGSGQVNEALQEYVEVLKINPRHALTHVNAGVMLVRINKLKEAIAQFEAALRLEPTNRVAQEYLDDVRAHLATKP